MSTCGSGPTVTGEQSALLAEEQAALRRVATLVARAGATRLAIEEREGARLVSADANRSVGSVRQDEIVAAWKKWYAEAVRSAGRLVAGAPTPALAGALNTLAAPFTGSK